LIDRWQEIVPQIPGTGLRPLADTANIPAPAPDVSNETAGAFPATELADGQE
jgi:hypothetical protein